MITAVLYGSLLPFNTDWTVFQHSSVFGLFHVGLRHTNVEDLVTNFLLYVPVGLALVLCGKTHTVGRFARLPVAVFVGAAVSLLAETLQTGITLRVASWTDVALNVLGTMVGATLGAAFYGVGIGAARRLRRRLLDRPFATLASLLTIGLFLYSLAPFDFITNTAELHASFVRTGSQLGGAHASALGNPFDMLTIDRLGAAAWFAVLGYMLALAGREAGRPSVEALGSAIKHGFLLATLVEFMQLFSLSHQCDLAVLVLHFMAVASGAYCAVFVVDPPEGGRRSKSPRSKVRRGSPRGLKPAARVAALVALAVFQVFAILIPSAPEARHGHASVDHATRLRPPEQTNLPNSDGDLFYSDLRPTDLGPSDLRPFDLSSHVRWMPFEALWRRPMAKAAGQVLSDLAVFSALALTIVLILRAVGHAMATQAWTMARAVSLITVTMVMLVAMGAEALKALAASRTLDFTDPLLALAAVLGVLRLCTLLRMSNVEGVNL